jgi:hypothetical protein
VEIASSNPQHGKDNYPFTMSESKSGTALSIQERIRAMNETLDTVDRKPSQHHVVNDNDEITASSSIEKRTSVVDIWRMREGGAKSTGGRVTKSSSIANDGNNSHEGTLNDVKTTLSSRFSTQAGGDGVNTWKTKKAEEEEKKQGDDDETNPSTSKPTNKWGPIRSVATASPTPPPLPGSNRKTSSVTQSAPKQSYIEPTDLTILPATSSASSSNDTLTSKRSNKVASIWEKLSGRSVQAPTMEAAKEPAEETPPPKRTSVVDIWQKRASPDSGDLDAIETSSVSPSSSKSLDMKFKVASSPPGGLNPVETSPLMLKKTPVAKWQKPQQRGDSYAYLDIVNSKSAEFSPSSLKMTPVKTRQSVDLDIAPAVNKNEDQYVGIKPVQTSPFTPGKSTVKNWLQKPHVGGSLDRTAAKNQEQAASPKRNVSIANRRAQRMNELIQTSSVAEASDEPNSSPSASTASPPIAGSGTGVVGRWKSAITVQADDDQHSPAQVDNSNKVKFVSSPGSVKDRWSSTKFGKINSFSAEAEQSGTEPERSPIRSKKKIAERWNSSSASNSSARSLPNAPVPAREHVSDSGQARGKVGDRRKQIPIQPPPVFSNNKKAKEDSLDRSQGSIGTPSKVDSTSDGVLENMPDNVNDTAASASVEEVNNKSDSLAHRDKTATLQSDPGTQPQVGIHRGNVTDRYKVQVSSASPGSISEHVSALVNEHASRTPTGQLRQKGADRWNESRTHVMAQAASGQDNKESSKIPDTSSIDSDPVETPVPSIDPPGSGPFISSIIEKGQDKQAVEVGRAAAESGEIVSAKWRKENGPANATPVFEHESVSPLGKKQALQVRTKVAGRWTAPSETASSASVVGKQNTSEKPDLTKLHGKVADRWKLQDASSLSSSTWDSASAAKLLKMHSGNTPVGKVRSKFAYGQQTSMNASSSLVSESSGRDFDGSVSETKSVAEGWNRRVELTEAIPTAGFGGGRSVVALVKEHAGQTPFGQKRGEVVGRRQKDGDSVESADAAISEIQHPASQHAGREDTLETQFGAPAAVNDCKRVVDAVVVESEQPSKSSAQQIRGNVADRWKKRLAKIPVGSEARVLQTASDLGNQAAGTDTWEMLPNQSLPLRAPHNVQSQVPSPESGDIYPSFGLNDTDLKQSELGETNGLCPHVKANRVLVSSPTAEHHDVEPGIAVDRNTNELHGLVGDVEMYESANVAASFGHKETSPTLAVAHTGGQSESNAIGVIVVNKALERVLSTDNPVEALDTEFLSRKVLGQQEVELSDSDANHLLPSHAPRVSDEKWPSDGMAQMPASIDYAVNVRRVLPKPAFVPVSGSEMLVPSRALQGRASDGMEIIGEKGTDLGSPLRIIQAWSEKIVPARSKTPSSDLNCDNADVIREASKVFVPAPQISQELASNDVSLPATSSYPFPSLKSVPGRNSNESELTSAFQIIEAWSQKASPLAAELPKPANSRKDLHPSQASVEAATSEEVDASVRPANSSAFAPWNNGVEMHSEDKVGFRDEPSNKNRKNLMMLGRKHVVNRSQQRPESVGIGKAGVEFVQGRMDTSFDLLKRKDVNDKGTVEPAPSTYNVEDGSKSKSVEFVANRDAHEVAVANTAGTHLKPSGDNTIEEREADATPSPSELIRLMNSGAKGAGKLGNPVSASKRKDPGSKLPSITQDEVYRNSTPVISNCQGFNNAQEPPLKKNNAVSKNDPVSMARPEKLWAQDDEQIERTGSLSMKKLASDKISNKKRLQNHRRKVKKTSAFEGQTYDQERFKNDFILDECIDSFLPGDQARGSEISDSSPQARVRSEYNGGHDAPPNKTSDSGLPSSHSGERSSIVRSPESEAEQSDAAFSRLSDTNNSAFAEICKTSSTTSSSSLANKAEKLLQERRRRSTGTAVHQNMTDVLELSQDTEDSHVAGSLPKVHASRTAQYELEDSLFVGHTDREEVLIDNGRPRLSTRYNTSSRFMDADVSTASVSAPGMTTDGSESVGSSCCLQSMESVTSGSDSRYYTSDKHTSDDQRATTKRRQLRANQVKGSPAQLSEKSVNMSSQSVWDLDGNMVSFDFKKLASAVDERVAALRDFVGGGSQTKAQKQSQPPLKLPKPANLPMDVEDVAIEVEYVEDSSDEDDPEADLGMCTAPLDNVIHSSLQCSAETRNAMSIDFTRACSDMLPAGEPSFEQTPASRKHGRRNGYV